MELAFLKPNECVLFYDLFTFLFNIDALIDLLHGDRIIITW